MMRVALTGGLACGKSLVARLYEERGVPVCDTDVVAHALMEPGRPVHGRIVDAFGAEMLDEQGAIDRRRLGRVVFADPKALARLNAISHPAVADAVHEWLAACAAGTPMAVVVIPLLYEAGMEKGWDAVICVASPVWLQVERLTARGLSEAEIRDRLAAQWPVAEKAARADYVIYNAWTIDLLNAQAMAVLDQILESRHG